MEQRPGPVRRLWQEIALVTLGVLETALVLWIFPFPPEPGTVVRCILALASVVALLARFRHWRWLLPLLLLLDAASGSMLILAVAPFAYAARSPSRVMSGAVALLGAASASLSLVVPVPGQTMPATGGDVLLIALTVVLIASTSFALGVYASTRRLLLEGLRMRAEEAEARRADAEEHARRTERTRIAREMHDIVAHKISLVALQAGALEVNPDLERERVVESAGLIRATATEALSELRQVLGVLRGSEDAAPLAPQPTWEDVRRLVTSSKEAGITVDLFDFVDDEVPDALARTVYRVVQEGLTNIHKHARATAARVALIGEPGEDLVVEVSNVLPQGFTTDLPGARMGLSGIEARVAHAGGVITSGPTDDGRFSVKAVIPWPERTA